MDIEQIVDRLAQRLGFFSIYEAKDNYGYYGGNHFTKDSIIFKTYYWNGWHGFLNAAMKRSRSGILCGDPALRVHRVEYTKKYWEKVDRVFAASAQQAKLLAAKKAEYSPRVSRTKENSHAETTVCPPGIH